MNRPVLATAALLASLTAGAALAQSAPLRGIGVLALNAADVQVVPGTRNAAVETSDGGGGGGTAIRNERGSGDVGVVRGGVRRESEALLPDALPPAAAVHASDPAAPVVGTPKKPSYRWQSLVPGAIK